MRLLKPDKNLLKYNLQKWKVVIKIELWNECAHCAVAILKENLLDKSNTVESR